MKKDRFYSSIIWFIELARVILAAIGFGFAFTYPEYAPFYLLLWVVVPLTGLTGFESLAFSKQAAEIKARQSNPYQIQSAMNNLATAIVGLGVIIFQANTSAQIAIIFVALVFFALSSLQHFKEYLFQGARIHLWRFILTLVLWGCSLPLLWRFF